jgi:VanZ family protein
VVVLVIAYGTLYPFAFHARPDSPGPLHALAATYGDPDSRSDIVANILLYIPFGFFAIQALRRPPGLWSVILVTLAGTVLSFSGEFLQYYIPGRDSDSGHHLECYWRLPRGGCGDASLSEVQFRFFPGCPAATLRCSHSGVLAGLPAFSVRARD